MVAQAREQSSKANRDLVASTTKVQNLERLTVGMREEMQTLESRMATSRDDQERYKSELNDSRSSKDEAVEAERRKAHIERARLNGQLRATVAKAKEEEQKAIELLQREQAVRVKWQQLKEGLEQQIERLTAENTSLREKSRKLLRQ